MTTNDKQSVMLHDLSILAEYISIAFPLSSGRWGTTSIKELAQVTPSDAAERVVPPVLGAAAGGSCAIEEPRIAMDHTVTGGSLPPCGNVGGRIQPFPQHGLRGNYPALRLANDRLPMQRRDVQALLPVRGQSRRDTRAAVNSQLPDAFTQGGAVPEVVQS